MKDCCKEHNEHKACSHEDDRSKHKHLASKIEPEHRDSKVDHKYIASKIEPEHRDSKVDHKYIASKNEHEHIAKIESSNHLDSGSEYIRIRKRDVKNILLISVIAFLFVFAVAQTVDVVELKTGKDITIFGLGAESPNAYASSTPRASSSGMVGGC